MLFFPHVNWCTKKSTHQLSGVFKESTGMSQLLSDLECSGWGRSVTPGSFQPDSELHLRCSQTAKHTTITVLINVDRPMIKVSRSEKRGRDKSKMKRRYYYRGREITVFKEPPLKDLLGKEGSAIALLKNLVSCRCGRHFNAL